jgi:hypothetical protein
LRTSRRMAGSPTPAGDGSTVAAAIRNAPRNRAKTAGAKAGYVYLHSAIDGLSPGWPTPNRYRTRKVPPPPRSWPAPRSGSSPTASPTSTASSPTTAPATGQPTSLGSSASGPGTRRPARSRPGTTARSSGISGSSPRSCYTPVNTATRTTGQPPWPCGTSTTTTIAPTAPQAADHQPPSSKPASPTSALIQLVVIEEEVEIADVAVAAEGRAA